MKNSKPRRQEERRQGTTDALIQATIELLAERGYAALTMPEVADRAGVSRGALTHYYPNRVDMVISAARAVLEYENQAIQADTLSLSDREATIDVFLGASERFFFSRNFIALIELVIAARKDEAFRNVFSPMAADYRRNFDTTWITALIEAGLTKDDAQKLVEMTNIMMRGMALSRSHGHDQSDLYHRLEDVKAVLKSIARDAQTMDGAT